MPAEKEVMILFAAANGYLDEWPESEVYEYENQMLEYIESKYADQLNEIKDTGAISDDLAEKLKEALDEFKTVFQPSA
jgi:F-type H+-transporting ATPase subunit alpha